MYRYLRRNSINKKLSETTLFYLECFAFQVLENKKTNQLIWDFSAHKIKFQTGKHTIIHKFIQEPLFIVLKVDCENRMKAAAEEQLFVPIVIDTVTNGLATLRSCHWFYGSCSYFKQIWKNIELAR